MKFQKISKVSVADEVIDYIKELILADKLKPGEQLPSEERMADQMGVGRGTIREALKVLIYLGIVERRGKSTFVAEDVEIYMRLNEVFENFKSHRDIMEIIEVRKIIEPEAAALAAIRGSTEDKAYIERYFDLMSSSQEKREDFIDYDHDFHLAVIRASGNEILSTIIKGIQGLMKKNQEVVLKESNSIMPRSLEFHRKIASAIKSGNEEEAKKYMVEHLLDVEREMFRIFKQKRHDPDGY